MKKLYTKYCGVEFESACTNTPEFKKFARSMRSAIKKDLANEGLELTDFNIGHFYVSGFVRNPRTGKYGYFNTGDVRVDLFGRSFLNNCYVRTAQSPKDYTGGMNHACAIYDMAPMLAKIV